MDTSTRRPGAARLWVEANTGKHPCQVCGTPVRLFEPYFFDKRGPRIPMYCGKLCRGKAQSRKVVVNCKTCDKEMALPPSHAKIREYCSRRCYAVTQRVRYTGHGNPNYRGGIQAIRMMIRNSPLYDHFRSDVLHRDGFKCQSCGAQAEKRRRTNTLDVHHIRSVDELLSLIFDPENGISLCPDCHTATHLQS